MSRVSAKSAAVFALMLPPEEREAYVAAVAPAEGARVAAGHLARERGDAWEAEVARHHRAALLAGLAYMRKVGAPVRVGEGGRPTEWAGVGPADYQGMLADGRAVAVEAKSEAGRLQRDAVKPHQRRDLENVDRFGGVALVFLELHDDDGARLGCWAVPWRTLEGLWCVSRRAKPGRAGSSRAEDYITSRSVGTEELAGHEALPGCYLSRWASPSARAG